MIYVLVLIITTFKGVAVTELPITYGSEASCEFAGQVWDRPVKSDVYMTRSHKCIPRGY